MVRTPQIVRLVALLIAVAFFGAACSATPSWIPVESAAPTTSAAPAELAFVEEDSAVDAKLAEAPTVEVVEEDPAPSVEFCDANANIWIHSAALNQIGGDANAEMYGVALANVAEWLERATLLTNDEAGLQRAMFAAFTELQTTVASDFAMDWAAFTTSTAYANDTNAQVYEAGRDSLVSFLNTECDSSSMSDLRSQAQQRSDDLIETFRTDPSTVTQSDALPGHSIFTHSSGRLIASFPSAWSYDEGRSDALVDLIASPDIERFLAGEALDGVRLQLVEAATLDDFRTLIAKTSISTTCTRTNDLVDTGRTRLNLTQTFDCPDHGASIIGQYNEDRGLGLIIEASFDRVIASRADLLRLASIANSALWS